MLLQSRYVSQALSIGMDRLPMSGHPAGPGGYGARLRPRATDVASQYNTTPAAIAPTTPKTFGAARDMVEMPKEHALSSEYEREEQSSLYQPYVELDRDLEAQICDPWMTLGIPTFHFCLNHPTQALPSRVRL